MKVLLISHNPITTYQSMGKTFLSLFAEFNKDELCQLYVYPSLPDVDVCSSYYRITDRNVFESYLHFGRVAGKEIKSSEIDTTKHNFYENDKEESFIKTKKTPLKTLCRDIMWKCAKWYTTELDNWIKRENSTCIFLAPGEAKFIYDVALKISDKYNLPIITYICDEYYFVDKTEGFIDSLRLRMLQSKIRKLMKKTYQIVAISDEINSLYTKGFNVLAETIMTGATIPVSLVAKNRDHISSITYLGNLAYGRFDSILDIGRALDEINAEIGSNVKLFLYTRTLSDENRNKIDGVRSIEYCGYVTGTDFENALINADALLHIESFAEENIERVKNSISTKIADSLASGNPLVAYAPQNIASMQYLISSGSAFTITDKDSLKRVLKEVITNKEKRYHISKCAIESAKRNHIAEENSKKLKQLVMNEYNS